jgi:hypothetical protein
MVSSIPKLPPPVRLTLFLYTQCSPAYLIPENRMLGGSSSPSENQVGTGLSGSFNVMVTSIFRRLQPSEIKGVIAIKVFITFLKTH